MYDEIALLEVVKKSKGGLELTQFAASDATDKANTGLIGRKSAGVVHRPQFRRKTQRENIHHVYET